MAPKLGTSEVVSTPCLLPIGGPFHAPPLAALSISMGRAETPKAPLRFTSTLPDTTEAHPPDHRPEGSVRKLPASRP